jgi:hypothetical protein
VLTTLALIAALVALSALMFAVSPGRDGNLAGLASRPGDGDARDPLRATEDPATSASPADTSFLCDYPDYEQTNISAAEKDAAETTAAQFVRAAYGYTGSDAGAYEEEVSGRVLEECFWESSAGEEVEATEEMVRQGGEANAPDDWHFFEGFVGYYVGGEERVYGESGAEYLRVYGHAVWVSRKAGVGVGEQEALAGYQQGLTLVKRAGEEQWRVAYGESVSAYPSSDYEHAVDEKIEEIRHGG